MRCACAGSNCSALLVRSARVTSLPKTFMILPHSRRRSSPSILRARPRTRAHVHSTRALAAHERRAALRAHHTRARTHAGVRHVLLGAQASHVACRMSRPAHRARHVSLGTRCNLATLLRVVTLKATCGLSEAVMRARRPSRANRSAGRRVAAHVHRTASGQRASVYASCGCCNALRCNAAHYMLRCNGPRCCCNALCCVAGSGRRPTATSRRTSATRGSRSPPSVPPPRQRSATCWSVLQRRVAAAPSSAPPLIALAHKARATIGAHAGRAFMGGGGVQRASRQRP
jgi:hypothetical protein